MCFFTALAGMFASAGAAGAGAASAGALTAGGMSASAALAAATGGYGGSLAALSGASAGISTAGLLQAGSLLSSSFGTVMQAYGSYQSAEYNSQIARNNATLASYQAMDALTRGKTAEDRKRLETGLVAGKAKVRIAGSGIDVGYGSSLDRIGDIYTVGDTDALTISANAEREAWGYQTQASDYRSQAALRKAQGRFDVGAGLLTGAGTVASKWYTYRRGY